MLVRALDAQFNRRSYVHLDYTTYYYLDIDNKS